jgi:hypothetical protein
MRVVLARGGRSAGRASVAGLCSVLSLVLSSAPSALAARWSFVPSPANGVLNSVSCTSWSACTAVGFEGTSAEGGKVLAERWNGGRWSLQPMPAVPGGQSEFTDVSCGSRRFCVAAGTLVYSATFTGRVSSLVGTWDGSGWSIQKLRYGRTAGSVSCTSGRFCVLVEGCILRWCEKIGSVLEEWNGSSWSPMRGTGRLSGKLGAVSCVSATSCVGIAGLSSARWNGKTWSVVAPLDTSFVPEASWAFGPPSCASVNSCAIVGSASQDCSCASLSFVERWNGTFWSEQRATATYTAVLNDVACGGPKLCTAVGDGVIQPETPHSLGFADRWNGAHWSRQSTIGPAGAFSGSLKGIYCAAARCVAVGSWQPDATVPLQTLVEQYR